MHSRKVSNPLRFVINLTKHPLFFPLLSLILYSEMRKSFTKFCLVVTQGRMYGTPSETRNSLVMFFPSMWNFQTKCFIFLLNPFILWNTVD